MAGTTTRRRRRDGALRRPCARRRPWLCSLVGRRRALRAARRAPARDRARRSRTAVFSAEQLLERLSQRLDLLKGDRDADPRQQTLRATIEWSHDLLSEEEQTLFARLGVFAGGCTYEAAEKVAGADPDTLQSLLDKSLVRKRDSDGLPRYWMLETIREFAAERLEESGEAEETRRRHAEWFLALAEEAYPHLTGSPKAWLDRLEREHDNLRGSLDRLQGWGETQLALRLAGALWKFWNLRGHLTEGSRRLESTLRADERGTVARAMALNGATATALGRGDGATARLHAEEALALHQTLGDAWGVANSLLLLGNVAAEEGELERAYELFDESLHRFRDLGDEHYTLLSTRLLAWMSYDLGDRERARALHEEVVRQARATGNERMQATSLGALGEYALYENRVEEALPMLKEAYGINRDVGDPYEIVVTLFRLARAVALEGRGANAACLFSSSEALREKTDLSSAYWLADMNEGTLAMIHTQLDEVTFAAAWDEGRTLSADEAVALALGQPPSSARP